MARPLGAGFVKPAMPGLRRSRRACGRRHARPTERQRLNDRRGSVSPPYRTAAQLRVHLRLPASGGFIRG